MIDLERTLDITETYVFQSALQNLNICYEEKKWFCGQNNFENIGLYKLNKIL